MDDAPPVFRILLTAYCLLLSAFCLLPSPLRRLLSTLTAPLPLRLSPSSTSIPANLAAHAAMLASSAGGRHSAPCCRNPIGQRADRVLRWRSGVPAAGAASGQRFCRCSDTHPGTWDFPYPD